MQIHDEMPDEQLLLLIGQRLARLRLAKNLTQKQVADEAGLGLRTVQRLESGAAATQLSGFVRVCRVLGLVPQLNAFIPETPVSPMAQLKLKGRTRRRASRPRTTAPEPKEWTWDEPS